MATLTPEGEKIVAALADRYSVGVDAVKMMLDAVARGGGSMAQFNLPEFGGNGQWMRGGMTMVGDMFNNSMKATVDNLCNDLSRALENQPNIMTVFAPQTKAKARAREVAAQVSGSPHSRDRGGRPSWGVPRQPGRRIVCGTPISPAATGWRSMIAGASKSMTPLATTLAVSVSNKAAMLRSLSRISAALFASTDCRVLQARGLPPKHALLQPRSRHLLPPALIPARS